METIVAKKCSVCASVKPIEDYRWLRHKQRHSAQCFVCERERALGRYYRGNVTLMREHIPDPLNAVLNNFRAAESANNGLFWRVA